MVYLSLTYSCELFFLSSLGYSIFIQISKAGQVLVILEAANGRSREFQRIRGIEICGFKSPHGRNFSEFLLMFDA